MGSTCRCVPRVDGKGHAQLVRENVGTIRWSVQSDRGERLPDKEPHIGLAAQQLAAVFEGLDTRTTVLMARVIAIVLRKVEGD